MFKKLVVLPLIIIITAGCRDTHKNRGDDSPNPNLTPEDKQSCQFASKTKLKKGLQTSNFQGSYVSFNVLNEDTGKYDWYPLSLSHFEDFSDSSHQVSGAPEVSEDCDQLRLLFGGTIEKDGAYLFIEKNLTHLFDFEFPKSVEDVSLDQSSIEASHSTLKLDTMDGQNVISSQSIKMEVQCSPGYSIKPSYQAFSEVNKSEEFCKAGDDDQEVCLSYEISHSSGDCLWSSEYQPIALPNGKNIEIKMSGSISPEGSFNIEKVVPRD